MQRPRRRLEPAQSPLLAESLPVRRSRRTCSPPFPVVFPGCCVFTAHSLRCGCAGRSYRSHSTSRHHELMGARRTTRTTRRAHRFNAIAGSGLKLAPVAYGYEPVVCAKTSIKPPAFGRYGWAHSRLELGAASAGRSVRTAQPASSTLVVISMQDACVQPKAAGLRLDSRCRRHICAVPC